MDTHLCIHVVLFRAMTTKNVGLRIRVEKELREAFQGACAAENMVASDVLRDFMQKFSERHLNAQQLNLFTATPDVKPQPLSTRNSK